MRRTRFLAALAVAALLGAAVATGVTLVVTGGSGDDSSAASPAGARELHPVAGDFEADDTRVEECGADGACYEQALGNVAFRSGPQAALAQFERLMAARPEVEANCHRIAHSIGSAALARFDGDVGRTFALGSSTCWSGYYHGVLERAFIGASSLDELGRVARGLCDDGEIRRTTWLAYQCVHGLGHGLMIQTGYALPTSLKVCDRLATEWDQTSCHGGVFMENISSSYGVQSKWLKDDDLVYPCNAIERRYKPYCYLMVTSRILEATGYDWDNAVRTCAGVERAWVATCFQSLGRDASGFSRQSADGILRICSRAGSGQSDCIYGAARDVTANYASGKPAARLCRKAPRAERPRCFNGIGTIVASFHTTAEGRRRACAEFAGPYLRNCLEGAAVA